MKNSVRVFTLYAKEDENFIEELTVLLSRLRRMGLVHYFSDKEISPIESWDDKIREDFETCDYLLFVVSPALLMSHNFQQDEIKLALLAAEQQHLRAIPILLRSCDLSKEMLNKFPMLPANKHAVNDYLWGNKNRAWRAVTEGLESILKGEEPVAEELIVESLAPVAKTPVNQKRKLSLAMQFGLSLIALSAMAGVTYQVSNSTAPPTIASSIVEQAPKVHSQIVASVPRLKKEETNEDEMEYVEEEFIPHVKKDFTSYAAKKSEQQQQDAQVPEHIEEQVYIPSTVIIKPTIKENDLAEMIYSFSQGSIDESGFIGYFCKDFKTPVLFNNNAMNFEQMCSEIKKLNPRKIKKINITSIEYQGGCVKSLSVEVRKKGWFR